MSGKASPTSTLSVTPTPISTIKIAESGKNNTYGSYKTKQTPSAIPATGSPTILLPILFSGLGGGFFLKKAGKK